MPKEFILEQNQRNEQKKISDYSCEDNLEKSHGVIHQWFFQQRRGIAFILAFSFSLFILLSLVSFSKTDPNCFGLTTLKSTVINSGGWAGAYLADMLFFLVGWMAYAIPFFMAYLGWFQLYPSRFDNQEKKVMGITWQATGILLLFLGVSGFSSLIFGETNYFYPYNPGGILGNVLSKMLSSAIQPWGSLLSFIFLCLIGITLLTGLSWFIIVEEIGGISLDLFSRLMSFIQDFGKTLCDRMIRKKTPVLFDPLRSGLHGLHGLHGLNELNTETREEKEGPRINEKTVSMLSASIERNAVSINTHAFPQEVNLKKPESSSVSPLASSSPSPSSVTRSHPRQLTSFVKEGRVSVNSLPPLSLLEPAQKMLDKGYSSSQLENMAREVEQRLLDFGIEVQVVAVHPGPVITRFELQLAAGVKVSRITGLAKDLARSLSVSSVRVVDIIPGKPVIGLELPNQQREMVRLSEVFLTDQFQQARSSISMALGVDISGYPVVVDLAKMPHLLVAGTTGSGKSVGLNAMLLSILFKATPEMVRLILVDPKMLEFSIYDGIPHLLTPVVTDMKEAAGALRWCVAEMERRYRLMSALGVRNLAAYNAMIKEGEQKGELIQDPLWKPTQDTQPSSPYLTSLPFIVVVIDELADMMMVVGKKVEQLIARIAQKARAAGIHLLLATQRPSVDVLTGLIKSNIPTRIAFQVSSKIDSRTILDQQGAEQLLGHGDMLYLTPGSGSPVRIHGAFVDDKEVHRVTDAWRALAQPEYVDIIGKTGFDSGSDNDLFADGSDNIEEADPLYDEAVQFVTESRKASISSLQRRLKIGYNRAARLIEEMERTGIVSGAEAGGVRDVLVPRTEE